ncbi:MAG: MBL fold metallo-hydrolase [Dinoroseobacter sp.]|nr:MBL fold metallo-hydrolase [Dinoroseobacter sp.]
MTSTLPPRPDRVVELEPGLRRVLANNASPMTYWGTNSYIVGRGEVAVIDPGPADPDHLLQIQSALGRQEKITHIFVTHAHRDHSPGARALSETTGAPVYAFGPAAAGRSKRMQALADTNSIAGGEGVDALFVPNVRLADADQVAHGDWMLRALWTPGHFGNHMSFAFEAKGWLFSGDLVMGWASSLVSPPDGDLGAFMNSLDALSARTSDRVYLPGHGNPIVSPLERVAELRAHRQLRHAQILAALRNGPGSAMDLAERIYTDTPALLLPAATRNVLAHLLEMEKNSEAVYDGALHADAVFRITQD